MLDSPAEPEAVSQATDAEASRGLSELATVTIDGDLVHVSGLDIRSSDLAQLLMGVSEAEWPALLLEVVSLGTRGMASLALSATVEHADARFQRSLEQAIDRLQVHVGQVIDNAGRAIDDSLDPDRRTSVMGRAISELTDARVELIGQFDLRRADSQSSLLVEAINQMIGPSGEMQHLLEAALDPDEEASALGRIASQVDQRFTEIRDLMLRQDGARQEAERGTAKGLDFEATIDQALRAIACRIGSCVVEATGSDTGRLSAAAKVGDFVIENPQGHRIVVEAKNKATLTLTGKTGILSELDRALENRQAHFAICVSASDAFPSEVGGFGVYGNRLLVVDDGEGTLLEAGVRWAFAQLALTDAARPTLDVTAIRERIDRIRQHSGRLTSIKRSLSALKESVDRVHSDIGGLQADLRDEFDEMEMAMGNGGTELESSPLRAVSDQ